MYRYLAMVIFIVPKLILWPLMWYWRCQRKRCSEAQQQELLDDSLAHNVDIKTIR